MRTRSSCSRVEAYLVSSGTGNGTRGVQRQLDCGRHSGGNKGHCSERGGGFCRNKGGLRRGGKKKKAAEEAAKKKTSKEAIVRKMAAEEVAATKKATEEVDAKKKAAEEVAVKKKTTDEAVTKKGLRGGGEEDRKWCSDCGLWPISGSIDRSQEGGCA
jgi:hypothetical protein